MTKGKLTCIILILLLSFSLFAANKTINLATINWEPYSGESLPGHGFFSEIIVEAFVAVGYDVKFTYLPWARALKATKEGEFDGIMDAYLKPDRLAYLEYPDVVWKVEEDFITLKSNKKVKFDGNLSSMKNVVIGTLNGTAQEKELKENGLTIQSVNSIDKAVKMLITGRIDAMLIAKSIFWYNLEKVDPNFNRNKISILSPPYKVYDMYVAFSKKAGDYKTLTADFNKGLAMIKKNGKFNRIVKKHDM
ncbi:MAG: transporter substrate-binding domain-containing protein [Spirochaetes bacterium]|nr:transporter substrate-binding domain-containing protein [Spirochaetota bacterium]